MRAECRVVPFGAGQNGPARPKKHCRSGRQAHFSDVRRTRLPATPGGLRGTRSPQGGRGRSFWSPPARLPIRLDLQDRAYPPRPPACVAGSCSGTLPDMERTDEPNQPNPRPDAGTRAPGCGDGPTCSRAGARKWGGRHAIVGLHINRKKKHVGGGQGPCLTGRHAATGGGVSGVRAGVPILPFAQGLRPPPRPMRPPRRDKAPGTGPVRQCHGGPPGWQGLQGGYRERGVEGLRVQQTARGRTHSGHSAEIPRLSGAKTDYYDSHNHSGAGATSPPCPAHGEAESVQARLGNQPTDQAPPRPTPRYFLLSQPRSQRTKHRQWEREEYVGGTSGVSGHFPCRGLAVVVRALAGGTLVDGPRRAGN